eukprot:SAG31_NODE_30202_length_384_cov_0.901754_1_plen_26_part_10
MDTGNGDRPCCAQILLRMVTAERIPA